MTFKELAENIDKNRLLVFSLIKQKKPGLSLETLEDAYSTASLKLLQQNKTRQNITINNLVLDLICLTYKEIGEFFKDVESLRKYVLEGQRHYDKINYNKLDPRFKNRLTPRQKIIFNLRCKHIPPSKMQTCYSTQNINQISYSIIYKYRKFMLAMQPLKLRKIKKLTGASKEIMLLYYNGFKPSTIAGMLEKNSGYVRTVICYTRKKLIT